MASATPIATPSNPPQPTNYNNNSGIAGVFGGGSPPSIYLISFIVIILVLILISSLLTLRTVRHRRAIHREWERTGYADSFFDSAYYRNNAPRGGHSAAARWAMLHQMAMTVSGNASDRRTEFGYRPSVWEVGMWESSDGVGGESSKQRWSSYSTDKGKGKDMGAGIDRHWDGITPLTTSIILPPPPPKPKAETDPSDIHHNPPTFWQTIRTVPVRPEPPAPTPPPKPKPIMELLESPTFERGEKKLLEVGVLIALPMEDGWAGLERDDGEKELPDVAFGVATVEMRFP